MGVFAIETILNKQITEYISKNKEEIFNLLKTLCGICAPSHHEEKRALFCKEYLESIGYDNVYIDDAKNVVCPINIEGSNNITVFAAHTDTVFPDTSPMPYTEKDGKIFCPSVGDDTSGVCVLLMAAKFFKENKTVFPDGIVILLNSCEEGLGNLKGIRHFTECFKNRFSRFVTFDGIYEKMAAKCVGSHRYRVSVKTEGGHSFQDFGNINAISIISEIISEIYNIDVPVINGSKTTYNVGTISGGTSVNTIAQNAEICCEYRSDNADCLKIMEDKFNTIFKNAKTDNVKIKAELIGMRPCSENVDEKALLNLSTTCKEVFESVLGIEIGFSPSSTDCNIPMSLGIPSICVGTGIYGNLHTREEWFLKNSILTGLEAAIKLILKLTER